ncbi:MAG: twin-arginine translocation signal domain-containing protein, partial [Planctomycetaceae bacterium]
MAIHKTCDGMQRRDFLKVGALGVGGLTLANYIQIAEAGRKRPGSAKAAIFINLTGGPDRTVFEVDETANRIRDEVDPEANIIFGSTFGPDLEGRIRVSVV